MSEEKQKTGCSTDVWDGWGHSKCSRKGVIEREGKLYCRQHDPVAKAKKEEERDAAWRAQWDEKKRQHRIQGERDAFARDCVQEIAERAAGKIDKDEGSKDEG